MIAKAFPATPRRRRRDPVDIRLTLKVNFGATPADAVTVMRERRIPMVNSVFEHRDRIVRTFAMTLVRVGMAQPKVASEVFPALKLLRRLTQKLF